MKFQKLIFLSLVAISLLSLPALHARAYTTIPVGTGPQFGASFGTKLYVSNSDGTVSVIDTSSDTVIDTVTTGNGPFYLSILNKKAYVGNSPDGTVSVIDIETDTVADTLSIGTFADYSVAAGSNIYFASDDIAVIDTRDDSNSSIVVAGEPYRFNIIGTKLYAGNSILEQVDVVDTLTDTLSDPITTTFLPYYQTNAGENFYVTGDLNSGDTDVVDSVADTVIDTFFLGDGSYYSKLFGEKLYVANTNEASISVVDVEANSVLDTITVANNPRDMVLVGNKLYVPNGGSASLSVIDTTTDAVVDTISFSDDPIYAVGVGKKLYVISSAANSVFVVDTETVPSMLPNLVSFSSSTSDGLYGVEDSIEITANFGETLQAGSTMTVSLNTGASVVLDEVSGATLSGTYVVGGGESSPDLSISSITAASVTDMSANNRTSYALPSSQGDFEGENSFITRNLGDVSNIEIGDFVSIEVGDNPYQISSPVTKSGEQYVYVANQGDSSMSVVRLSDHSVIGTISVGDEPYGLAAVEISGTTYIYVANTLSDTVSVIDTSSDTVIDTVDVGARPYYVAKVGTNVYVTNGASNTVSVIDANTNNIINTIPVGAYPRGIKAHGTDLYVANYGDENYSGGDYISVIDTDTDAVVDTIISPVGSDGPRGVNVLGDKVYVTNYRSHNVSVIDTDTNEITDTIEVGMGPRGIVGYGANVYVENFDDGTLSIINTNTNTVTDTVEIGHSPSGITVVGDDLYISAFQDSLIRIFDTSTGLLLEVEEDLTEESGGSSSSGSHKRETTFLSPVTEEPAVVAPTKSCHIFTTLMKRGSRDGEVALLQTVLTSLGHDAHPIDGIFGPITDGATKAFQKAKNIVIDGIVGPITRGMLNQGC